MKLSELILKLQGFLSSFGDCDIAAHSTDEFEEVDDDTTENVDVELVDRGGGYEVHIFTTPVEDEGSDEE
jgi:hypothetical protein